MESAQSSDTRVWAPSCPAGAVPRSWQQTGWVRDRRRSARTDILAIADTHLAAGQADRLIDRIAGELRTADVILHAGDVTDRSILDALMTQVPAGCLHAVRGNNDVLLDELPERLAINVEGCCVAMIHDSGPAAGRAKRLRKWFPDADLVVFGHSHLPWHETCVRERDGHVQHHVNPGSAMLRRRAPTCSVAHVVVANGALAAVRHVSVGAVDPVPVVVTGHDGPR
jgi:putative phosphoesterase